MRNGLITWNIALCGVLLCVPLRMAAANSPQRDGVALVDCEELPAPFDCGWNQIYELEGTGCPKGDIPYFPDLCGQALTDWFTLYTSVETEYSYEYRTTPPSPCPGIPQFWGPSSNGTLVIEPSGCPVDEANNCRSPWADCTRASGATCSNSSYRRAQGADAIFRPGQSRCGQQTLWETTGPVMRRTFQGLRP